MFKKILLFSGVFLMLISCSSRPDPTPDPDPDKTTVESVSKTSITKTTGGSIVITYTLKDKITEAPTLTVTSETDEEIGVPVCELSEDGDSAECTVSGIDGCNEFTDYTATLSGTVEDYSFIFNSADDEFDSNDTLTNCWFSMEGSSGTAVAKDGMLTLTVPGNADPEDDAGNVQLKSIASVNIAVLTHHFSFTVPVIPDWDSNSEMESGFVGDSYSVLVAAQDGGGDKSWYSGYSAQDSDTTEEAVPIGDFDSTFDIIEDFYVCLVRYGFRIKAYVSFDGELFTQLTHSNMECDEDEPCAVFTNTFESYPDAYNAAYVAVAIGNSTADSTKNVVGVFGPVRFKTTDITGTGSSDCPSLLIE